MIYQYNKASCTLDEVYVISIHIRGGKFTRILAFGTKMYYSQDAYSPRTVVC